MGQDLHGEKETIRCRARNPYVIDQQYRKYLHGRAGQRRGKGETIGGAHVPVDWVIAKARR